MIFKFIRRYLKGKLTEYEGLAGNSACTIIRNAKHFKKKFY